MVEQYSPSLDLVNFFSCSQFVTYVMSVKGSELYSANRERNQEIKSKVLLLTIIKCTINLTVHTNEQERQVRPSEK